MQPILRPNHQRAKIAIILIWVTLGIQVLGYISDFFQLMLLDTVMSGGDFDYSSLDANDARQQYLGYLSIAILIVSAVTFLMWFRRAYFNLGLIDPRLSHTDGWAVGFWFIPIASLFKPFQMMREMFNHTQFQLEQRIPNFPRKDQSMLLGWWWALWIINNFWGNISFRLALDADSIDKLYFSTTVSIWNCLVSVPLAILAVNMIKEYSGMESLLATTNDPSTAEQAGFGKEV
jgi:hypothetical protein